MNKTHSGKLVHCKECNKHKCLGCSLPYTLSTANDQSLYCSRFCEQGRYKRG